jgi:hypothetical protein
MACRHFYCILKWKCLCKQGELAKKFQAAVEISVKVSKQPIRRDPEATILLLLAIMTRASRGQKFQLQLFRWSRAWRFAWSVILFLGRHQKAMISCLQCKPVQIFSSILQTAIKRRELRKIWTTYQETKRYLSAYETARVQLLSYCLIKPIVHFKSFVENIKT